jgi:hypothetical protein
VLRRLQLRASPLGHVVMSARRTGIEPVASGFGDRRPAIGTSGVFLRDREDRDLCSLPAMRREGFEPPSCPKAFRVTAWCNRPLCHLRVESRNSRCEHRG